MTITEQNLIENGKLIIAARRRVWDLERRQRYLDSAGLTELTNARREYRRLLAVRKAMAEVSQKVLL